MAVWMGLDLGEKRVGVALTDEAGMMATPLTTIEHRGRNHLGEEVKKLAEEYRVEKIVVGLPKTLKGEVGIAAQKVTTLFKWLESQIENDWVLWDERLTTAEVERVLLDADVSRQKRKEVRDQLAAQRILQSYLDSQKAQGL